MKAGSSIFGRRKCDVKGTGHALLHLTSPIKHATGSNGFDAPTTFTCQLTAQCQDTRQGSVGFVRAHTYCKRTAVLNTLRHEYQATCRDSRACFNYDLTITVNNERCRIVESKHEELLLRHERLSCL